MPSASRRVSRILDRRLRVLDGFLEDRDGIFLGLLLQDLHRSVHEPLGDPRLPLKHHRMDHLRDENVPVHGIGRNDSPGNVPSPGHDHDLLGRKPFEKNL
jgi:hypothetical protein